MTDSNPYAPLGSGRTAPASGSQPGEPATSYISVPLTAPSSPSRQSQPAGFPPPADSATPLWPGQAHGRTDSKSRPGWILALRVASAVVAVLGVIGGIVGYIQVSALSAAADAFLTFIRGFYPGGLNLSSPNTALALLTLIACWVLGGCAAVALMVIANLAEDVVRMKALLQTRPPAQP